MVRAVARRSCVVRVAAMAAASLDSVELPASCSESASISCNACPTCAFSRTIPHDSSIMVESSFSMRSACVDARFIQAERVAFGEGVAVL